MKFLTDFTYQHLHGFARFPGDSTALVIVGSRNGSAMAMNVVLVPVHGVLVVIKFSIP